MIIETLGFALLVGTLPSASGGNWGGYVGGWDKDYGGIEWDGGN